MNSRNKNRTETIEQVYNNKMYKTIEHKDAVWVDGKTNTEIHSENFPRKKEIGLELASLQS
jgi:hypothetical protein